MEIRPTFDPLHASRLFAPPDRTLPTMLSRRAKEFGDRPLVTAGDETWSYAQARDAAARFAGTLAEGGLSVGDRVALICSNRIAFIQIFLGCAWLGAVVVPVNTASRGPQLQHILSNSGARVLIVERDFIGNLGHVNLASLPLQTIWVIDGSPKAAVVGVPSEPLPSLGEARPPASLRPSDLLAILYTSGTTGPSKGVCCPHAQYFWWGLNTAHLLGLRQGDVLHTTLPLFHTNALNTFFQALLLGNHVVYGKRFSASNFFRALVEHQASVTYLLGAMVPILLARPPDPAERAHHTRIALAPGVPARFQSAFTERTGIHLLEGYGSTETNFAIGTTIERQRPGTMGPVFEGFEARVVDEDDNEVPNPANWYCARMLPLHSQPGTSACRTRPSKPGETCGFTPAIASCAAPTDISVSSIASRMQSAAAAKTFRPSKSSRFCSATQQSPMSRFLLFLRSWQKMRSWRQ
jgi:carnitine-CoA ligase